MTALLPEFWRYDCAKQSMSGRELFEQNLDVIERAIVQVCRQVRLQGADAEDFASTARIALLADDGAILRKFEGRSSFANFIAIVVRRLFLNQKRSEGRWYPSAEATRQGEAAILLDRLLHRDHRPLSEALAIAVERHPDVGVQQLRATAAALPDRAPRPRLVPVSDGDEERFAGSSSAEDRVLSADRERLSERASRVIRDALAAMSPQDRVTLRLRFAKGMAIADIARALGVAQRPLYRRLESLLKDLRRLLERAGIEAGDAADLVAAAGDRLDFGLEPGKTAQFHPSLPSEENR